MNRDRTILNQPVTKTPIIFLHIPKTAGTSIRRAVQVATCAASAGEGFDLCTFGNAFENRKENLPYRNSFYLNPGEFPNNISFFSGHIALSSLKAAYPTSSIFTILREPRSRILSTWLFWRSLPDSVLAPWSEWGDRLAVARDTLSHFLTDPRIACQTDNLCLRMLVWPHPRLPDADFIPPEADDELLDAAHRALKRLDFVGCVEDPALATRLAKFIGADIVIDHENATQKSPSAPIPVLGEELDSSTLALLGSRSRLDAVLWKRVVHTLGLGNSAESLAEASLLNQCVRYVGTGAAYASQWHRAQAIRAARLQADATAALMEARADILRGASAIEAVRAENDRISADLLAVQGSSSWRLTAPLRASKRLLQTLFRPH